MTARESPAGGQSAGQKLSLGGEGHGHDTGPPGATQTTLDEALDKALAYRDQGIQAALDGAHSWVRMNLERHLDELIDSGVEWTSDDLRERAEVIATSPNIIGALVRKASAEGRIVQVGFRESRRPEAHARVIRVWRRAS